MKTLRTRLTFANVTSCLALFVALGGLAVAAGLPKNSVGSKQLKANSVITGKIKNGAVTGAKITTSTLGTVPSALNAQSLDGMSADQIEQSSKLRCPGGTVLIAGDCFETASRPAAQFRVAVETCARAGRSLPSVGELAAYLVTLPVDKSVDNWAGSQSIDEGVSVAPHVFGSESELFLFASGADASIEYRCVTGPSD